MTVAHKPDAVEAIAICNVYGVIAGLVPAYNASKNEAGGCIEVRMN
ncbi:MAG: hypothetical protein R2741_07065 [Methanolobus sp.]